MIASAFSITSCVGLAPQGASDQLFSQAARPSESLTHKELLTLPKPAGKITAAVYSFSDLTGQNKPSPASSFSSAVTQGATNLLVKALLDSGWFTPLERNGLQNVLTERNLWNQRLAIQEGGGRTLSPMPAASIILAGGIVAYEFNVKTGGFGAKYLGIGGSTAYREDSVTISLRAINAKDGSILHSVNSSKSIFSRSVNTGLFGFVEFDKIAELEGGYSVNEQAQRSVEEAIESGLIDLILQGVLNGSWKLADVSSIEAEQFSRYLSDTELERYKAANPGIYSDTKIEPVNADLKSNQGSSGTRVLAFLADDSRRENRSKAAAIPNKSDRVRIEQPLGKKSGDVDELAKAKAKAQTIRSVSSAVVENRSNISKTSTLPAKVAPPQEAANSTFAEVPTVSDTRQEAAVSNLLLGLGKSAGEVAASIASEGIPDAQNEAPNRIAEVKSTEKSGSVSNETTTFVDSSELVQDDSDQITNDKISVDEISQLPSVGEGELVSQEGDSGRKTDEKPDEQLPADKDSSASSTSKEPNTERQVKGVILYAGNENNVEKGRELHQKIDFRFDGVEVELIRVDNEDVMYRVRIGPLSTPEDVNLVLGELKNMGVTEVDAEQIY